MANYNHAVRSLCWRLHEIVEHDRPNFERKVEKKQRELEAAENALQRIDREKAQIVDALNELGADSSRILRLIEDGGLGDFFKSLDERRKHR